MSKQPALVWFRADLRLRDHRALCAAALSGPVLPVFVLDDAAAGAWAKGGASRWWLHHALVALAGDIAARGGRLVIMRGEAAPTLARVATAAGARLVTCSRRYEPWARAQESRVRNVLDRSGIELKRYSGALLREPEAIATKSGEPFKVYTPFWRALVAGGELPAPVPVPQALDWHAPTQRFEGEVALGELALLPTRPDWAGGLRESWTPGEAGAVSRLEAFLDRGLARYGDQRNRPDIAGTSRLSPHLHLGEISPLTCWQAARAHAARHGGADQGLETFLKELVWREFSSHLLHHWPSLPETPFREDFQRFPWAADAAGLKAWQNGRTGYPIVDAGMRELWHTGWMHNRVRMIVASFLVKDLMVPWQEGEAWFWDTLVDADLASNAASWQWVAGSGADAAPYFRIFNPVKQGETFDPEGRYVRRWVPELSRLPAGHIHKPWLAPASALAEAGVRLCSDYPLPIVDHDVARRRALEAFSRLKETA